MSKVKTASAGDAGAVFLRPGAAEFEGAIKGEHLFGTQRRASRGKTDKSIYGG
jgi:hypothetical protein